MLIKRRQMVGSALAAIAAAVLVLTGCGAPTATMGAQEAAQAPNAGGQAAEHAGLAGIDIPHLHGLGFSGDGQQLVVPAHDGLRIFANGAWQAPDLPAHDYMGYSPADNGFYSSGHPQPGSQLINPLGLVKSTDGGKTLTQLGFEGESDFHLMGVGYRNHAIYVLNPAPNSKLSAGLHYSLDEGQTWQQSAARGLEANPIQLAVHPQQANVVALATEAGLFLSSDHGGSFERVGPTAAVTAVAFSPGGEQLFFGASTLSRYDLSSGQITTVEAPALSRQDALAYIAVNPVRPEEIAIATFDRNIYRSTTSGQSWEQIARNGKTL
jgi:hypothetical protein